MRKIFKYEMSIKEKQQIELPINSEIIRVDDVDGKLFLWAIVEPTKEGEETEKEVRFIEFYKTGQPIKTPTKNLKYLGFCKLFVGQELGIYVFEKK